ncbi:MAG: hypothetical protein Q7S65_03570 [Nanoarchaeota archaeon]|nr:hypothetical protein [Nanoarchaeota archaeon]
MASSVFRGVVEFFDTVGLYDVVLPFILVFTITFAILEKTRVLGTETVHGHVETRKNLNAMVAFVVSFLVIASSRLVEIITKVSSDMVILLMLSVLFLLLVGSFMKEGDPVYLKGGWQTFFMFVMFIGIALIFMNAITDDNGVSWLDRFWNFVSKGQGGDSVGAIILLGFFVLFIAYIIREPGKAEHEEEHGDSHGESHGH